MITEKQLFEWEFEKGQTLFDPTYIFAISTRSQNELTIPTEYVEVDIERKEVAIFYNHNYISLTNCTTKRKVDQALRLLGLTSIDKLKEIKK